MIVRHLHDSFAKLAVWGNKTISHTTGLQRLTGVNIAILKLAGAIFPELKALFAPALVTLSDFRGLSVATSPITTLAKMIQAKKVTVMQFIQFINSIALTINFLASVDIIFIKRAAYVAQEMGSSNRSFLQAMQSLVLCNPVNTWMVFNSSFHLAYLIVGYYQAKTGEERACAISTDKRLLFAQHAGRLCVVALSGVASPIFLACLDLSVSFASYVHFLVLPRS